MPRLIPAHRFRDLIDASTRAFIENGYRRTQMADVALALGLGKGTLYGYVEGKDALFYATLAHADRDVPETDPAEFPIATPRPGALLDLFAERVGESVRTPRLEAALALDRAKDVRAEFDALLRELYSLLESNRVGIKLMDRCASEIPELSEPWRAVGRSAELEALERYLVLRGDAGQLAPLPDCAIAARFILETLTTWAVHIHWDRHPRKYEARLVEETLFSVLLRGCVPPAEAG